MPNGITRMNAAECWSANFHRMAKRKFRRFFKLENAREESRHNRVLILPKDVLRAERYAREKKLDVIGYYHSHPNAPAVPSQYDLEHALPVWSYVIASVIEGKAVRRSLVGNADDRSNVNEESILSPGSAESE